MSGASDKLIGFLKLSNLKFKLKLRKNKNDHVHLFSSSSAVSSTTQPDAITKEIALGARFPF